VFLCCGALQSPALLRRSGLRRNIGNSLALHPTVKVVAFFPDEINSSSGEVAAQQVIEFAPRVCMGCSISTLPYISLAMASHCEVKPDVFREWRRAAIYYAMIAGPNTGVVRNVPFAKDPLVRYSLEKDHFNLLGTSLRDLCRLLFAAGATELYPSIAGCPPLKTEGDLRHIPATLPRDSTHLMTIHLFSSCVMGEVRDFCAVDSFGRVHGYQNLFVNDASLLCTAPGVNPQGSIMAIARRNALHFAKAL
jgi:choline dehydrogenase-like flavoprotein